MAQSKDKNVIGAFIKTFRKGQHMKQEKLAELVGCSKSSVSAWETGRQRPSLQNMISVMKVLSISKKSFQQQMSKQIDEIW